MGIRALIGLGSNLGDRKAHLDAAIDALGGTPDVEVHAVSLYQETAPVGGPAGQGAFLNAAAVLESALEPEPLLDILNAVENRAGRVRNVRWGERTLDLDLLLFDDRVIDTPRLRVPHPRMALRRFVLAPLAEIAPAAIDPLTGLTIAELLANLDQRPSHVALHGADGPLKALVYRGIIEGLRSRGWLSSPSRDRWLVTDYCLPIDGHPSSESTLGLSARPTFAVILGDDPALRTKRLSIPLLWPESSEPDAIVADVLAACAATRSA